ncbi:tetratricopeptide repeat protein [Crenothrix polyspora]|uniref:Uncharacterized protein n=1 Tax=Crenothrix polyspora TaxID=360316 RepID=A0A1R4HDG8_9GAMM|nr:hypothetical protein [Crenothrix polyspora]SJM94254.1 conserved hypothetical protein [Crenothrix polyspora]
MQKTTPNLPVNNKTDLPALELSAASKVQSGNYKDAIELYKTLLKTTEKSEWRQALAQCYLQRALTFAAKGMIKEAIVLWESYAQHNRLKQEYFDHYISWLLQINDTAKVKKYLPQLTATQLDEQYVQLASILGLLMLTHRPELHGALPQDSLLIKHATLVQASLTAYRNNQPEAAEAYLQQLPFRSAFKDFRTLMKATLALPESPENAQLQLAKIPAESPYHSMASSLLACTHNGMALINNLTELTHKQAQLVVRAKKFTKNQTELLDVVIKQKQHLSDKLKFNLAIQHQSLFGVVMAKRYCYSALGNYSAGQRDFNKHFGALDEFEECRLKALGHENNKNSYDALYYWKRCISLLKDIDQTPLNDLKIASVMRHLGSKKYSPTQDIDWLEQSLNHDTDRDTYLNVLNHYATQPQKATVYQQWLHKGLVHFPHDVDFLLIAMSEATQRLAFADVIAYAHRALKIDPVNIIAKQALFDSHLALLRVIIKTKKANKLPAALSDISALVLSKRDQLIVNIMQGFCLFISDKERGVRAIADAVQAAYDGLLCAYFYIMIEASAMGLQLAPVLKKLPPLAKDYSLSPQELSQFTALVLQYHSKEDSRVFVSKVLDKIKTPLKNALINQPYDEALLLALCQCLEHVGHFELMRVCTKVAQPLWDKPVWMYYRVYAEANGDAAQCSEINADRLDDSLNEAYEQNDRKAIVLIEKFLDAYYADGFDPKNLGVLSSLLGIGGNSKAEPMALFNDLPIEIFEQLDKKADAMIKKMGMDRFLASIIKQYFPSDALSAMTMLLKDFEGLQAFALLKAAEELNIPLTVTAADIINCIKGSSSSALPSFLR